jgi:flagellar basal body P-ring protein FlgI
LQCCPAQAERLKDIASIQGVRSNQLIGYGLVVGLNGSGDQTTQTPFTVQTFNNMMAQFGIKVPAGRQRAAEERGGCVDTRRLAAVRQAGADDRYHRVVHR